MALPLPNPTTRFENIVNAMQSMSNLTNKNLVNEEQRISNKYAPMTRQAEAASKLAYANLLGPQFLAKIMGNDKAVANMTEEQKANALKAVYQAGSGQGAGNNLFNDPSFQPQQESKNPLANMVISIKDAFGFEGNKPKAQSNYLLQNPNVSQNEKPLAVRQFQEQYPDQDKQMQDQFNKTGQGQYTVPMKEQRPKTWSERAGEQAGIEAEGKESGTLRAKDIQELNDTVFNAETKQATYDDINQMIASPEIREIRNIPLAGRHEMAWYAKNGTPEQQQLVGRLYAQMGNVVKDSSRDFAGQFRKGEQQLLQGMKPSDSDTVDAMIGKAESLSVMNKMLMERARLTSQIMSENHVNKLKASEEADKRVNGKEIREQFHNLLNPNPTEADIKYMAQLHKISEDEVRKQLKEKGYKLEGVK